MEAIAILLYAAWPLMSVRRPPARRHSSPPGWERARQKKPKAGPTNASTPVDPMLPCRAVLVSNPGVLAGKRYISRSDWQRAGSADPLVSEANIYIYKSVELEQEYIDDGHKVGPREHRELARDLARVRNRINRLWRGPQSNGRLLNIDWHIWTVGQVCRRFNWRWLGNARWRGHVAAIFSFAPKPRQRTHSRIGHFLAAMAGRVWLDPASGQVMQVRFHNLRPVRYGWGLLAIFHRVRGVFTLRRLPGGWFYHHLSLQLDRRELWRHWRGRIEKFYLPAK